MNQSTHKTLKWIGVLTALLLLVMPQDARSQCNVNTSICVSGTAGPFSFVTKGPAVSTCLNWSGPNVAYIMLNISTSGPLNMLIQGNTNFGYLDVAVFNVPTGVAPCTAIQNTANQIGCNYAAAAGGCNQFGSFYTCSSSVPAPNVVAGQNIMVVVENWSGLQAGSPTSFTLTLAPNGAQAGAPNPAITPAGPVCANTPAFQLVAADAGGTWSGPGTSSTGIFTPSTAGVGTHTISYTVGVAPCSASSSTTITVNAVPATPSVAGTTICGAGSATLSGTPAGLGFSFRWYNAASGGTLLASGNSYTASYSATTTVYVSQYNTTTGCESARVPVTVTVNTLSTQPTSISGVTSLCPGGSTTLTQVGGSLGTGASYQWFAGSCASAVIGSGPTLTVSPTSTTTYFVRASGTCNTTACASVTVTVNPLPSPSISGTTSICTGQSTTLTASGGGTYLWNTGATSASITVAPTSNTTYSVTVTSAAGCVNSTSATVVVNALPTAAVAGTNTICSGQSTTLTASGGGTYLWSTGATSASISVSPAATTTYTVTVTSAAGCTATASRTVTVNPLPAASVSGTLSICSGQSTTLTASGGGTYIWSTGATSAAITVNPASSTLYTVTVTSAAGCVNTASATVTVNALPTAAITGTNTICTGQSTTLTASGGGTYAWSTGATTASITVAPGATTNYTVTVTSGVGCTATASRAVTVLPLPTASNAGPDQTVCATTVTLAANTPSIGTGLWTVVAGVGGSFSNTASPTSTFTGTAGSSYTLRWSITNAPCAASTDDVVITFQTASVAPTSVSATVSTMCVGGSTQLTAVGGSLGTGASYQWYAGSCGGTFLGSGSTLTVLPTTTTTYFVRITGTCNTTACASATITVAPDPTISATGAANICSGATATLTSTVSGGIGTCTVQWQSSTDNVTFTNIPGANSTTYVTPALTATTYYRATYSCTGSSCDPATSGSFAVTVFGNLVATSAGATTICNGGNATLSSSVTGGTGAITYQWQSSSDNVTFTNIPGATSPSYTTPTLSSSTYYRVVVSATGAGCGSANSPSQLVTVVPDLTATVGGGTTICSGSTANLTSSVSGGTGSISYQWQISTDNVTFTPIVGATAATYTTTALTAIRYYNVVVSATGVGCGAATSNSVAVTVDQFTASNAGVDQFQCGTSATLAANTPATGIGTWTVVSGTGTFVNANSPTTQVNGLSVGPNVFRWTLPNGACVDSQDDVTITRDNIAPVVSCPSAQSLVLGGACTATLADYRTLTTSSDNCGAVTLVQSPASGTTVTGLGTTVVTITATDINGNTASCNLNVTRVDNTPPAITCPANISVNAATGTCAATVNYTAPVGTDNCAGSTTTQIAGSASGASYPVGVTTNTFRVTDASGNTAICSFTVTVIDNQAPVITCPANISVNAATGACAANVTYTAPVGTDNCAGATTTQIAGFASGASYAVGVTTNTFRVTDAAGNTATCSFTVTVVDNQPPVIVCPSNILATASSPAGATVTYTAPIGSDNCAGATTAQTAGLASGATFPIGTTTNTFTVTAANGATTTCSFTVTVQGVAPTVTCPATVTVNNTPGLCTGTATYAATFTGIPTPTVTYSQASGSTFPVGTTAVTVTVTNAVGTSSCTFNVVVVDNQAPNALCNNVTVSLNAQGNGSTTTTAVSQRDLPAPVGTDNCAGATTTQIAGFASGASYAVGVTTNTFRVTDAAGNTATCSFTVTVVDNQPPVIVCPSNILATASSPAGATVTYTAPIGSDNCAGATTAQTAGLASGATFPIGTTTNTFTVTAANGATTTCSFTVTVQGVAPTVTCPATVTVNNTPGLCTGTATYAATFTGIPTPTVTYSQASGSTFPVGTTAVTVTVTNAVGTSSCTFNVVVVDNQAPNALCNNVTVSLNAQGNGSTTTTAVNNGSSDNCGVASVSLNNSSFTCANLGPNTVVLTVTDIHGNTSTCASTVLVQDVIPPTALCQNVTVQLNSAGLGSLTVSQVNNGSSDACRIASLTLNNSNFTCANVAGPNTVVLTVTDVNGNSDDNENRIARTAQCRCGDVVHAVNGDWLGHGAGLRCRRCRHVPRQGGMCVRESPGGGWSGNSLLRPR
ncbi:MAG: HYR domain-containing protein [Bacteroidia bacterium]